MKEFDYSFREGLLKGLRRFSTNPVNEEALVELHNLAPGDQGLEPHEALTSMDASGVTWGGLGEKAAAADTRDITISIVDYVDNDVDVVGASVYVDSVLVGTTDANGEVDVTLSVGGHAIRVVAAGYVDSDSDDLLNDYFVVA